MRKAARFSQNDISPTFKSEGKTKGKPCIMAFSDVCIEHRLVFRLRVGYKDKVETEDGYTPIALPSNLQKRDSGPW